MISSIKYSCQNRDLNLSTIFRKFLCTVCFKSIDPTLSNHCSKRNMQIKYWTITNTNGSKNLNMHIALTSLLSLIHRFFRITIEILKLARNGIPTLPSSGYTDLHQSLPRWSLAHSTSAPNHSRQTGTQCSLYLSTPVILFIALVLCSLEIENDPFIKKL